ncbi:hypothetical protein [Thermoflavimicrobium dichotomicum]|uniref:Spore coat protein n=1 Tax=Thermoflavimicrobium dichotomicum TaxID=46223 RepID=A0A1I3MJ46_9BACL|nr:hypothetical protein [Thermoflavimicrobium dichotomicum]SFI97038.1 hypothetical protein SAMN05421852_10391 [Thermoflavimicrobium dichotomicum]
MEQLTQMELTHVEELLSMEALAVKKYKLYSEQCKEKEWIPLFQEAMNQHQQRIKQLINQLRKHDGKETRKH